MSPKHGRLQTSFNIVYLLIDNVNIRKLKMSDLQELQEKIIKDIDEDAIIKKIMLEYPDLYDLLEFNEYTIKEKLEKNAWWFQNFRLLYIREKRKLEQIKIIHDEFVGNLYHQLRFENDITIGKIETEKYYIPKHPKVVEYRKLIMKQMIRVETFEAIKDAFKQQGYNMTQFIKNMEI